MFVSLFSLNEGNSEQIEVGVFRKHTTFSRCDDFDKWDAGEKNPGRHCRRKEGRGGRGGRAGEGGGGEGGEGGREGDRVSLV